MQNANGAPPQPLDQLALVVHGQNLNVPAILDANAQQGAGGLGGGNDHASQHAVSSPFLVAGLLLAAVVPI